MTRFAWILLFAAIGMLGLGFGMLLVAVQAKAHSWYDPWCCSGDPITGDCKPIAASEVTARPDGYHFREWVVPYSEARVSADRDFHWCEFPKGTLRCFYAPPGGV